MVHEPQRGLARVAVVVVEDESRLGEARAPGRPVLGGGELLVEERGAAGEDLFVAGEGLVLAGKVDVAVGSFGDEGGWWW